MTFLRHLCDGIGLLQFDFFQDGWKLLFSPRLVKSRIATNWWLLFISFLRTIKKCQSEKSISFSRNSTFYFGLFRKKL